jgi:hypothetical protein
VCRRLPTPQGLEGLVLQNHDDLPGPEDVALLANELLRKLRAVQLQQPRRTCFGGDVSRMLIDLAVLGLAHDRLCGGATMGSMKTVTNLYLYVGR